MYVIPIILGTTALGAYALFKIPITDSPAHWGLTILGGVIGLFIGIYISGNIARASYRKK